jgi:hypothetical protein
VSLALRDLSPEQAAVVRRLNAAGVPVTAWLLVPEADGYFCNLDNVQKAAVRYAAFHTWATAHDLRFVGVALDVETAIQELRQLATSQRGAVVRLWLRRLFDRGRLRRGLAAYRELLARMRADGFRTESFQWPMIVEERAAGATLFQRLLGVMDLRVDREWLMLYTSALNGLGLGMLWHYAGERYLPVVGDTAGAGGDPPLTWDAFARDLRLARRWDDAIGIYSLEGCVAQGFLARLRTFDWDAPVAQPSAARPVALGLAALRAGLWAAEYPHLALAGGLLLRRLLARPRVAAALLGAAWSYHRLLRPRLRTWGATPTEAAGALPGDDLVRYPRLQHTRAITIHAPPAAMWPWLVQMGFGRGGYYYPGWLDAVWDVAIRRRYHHEPWYVDANVVNTNAERIVPELQNLQVGDHIQDGPDGYFEVRELIPERALVLYSARHPLTGHPVDPKDPRVSAFVDFSWAFVLAPVDAHTTRLLVRLRADYPAGPLARAATYLIEPGDLFMQTLQLAGIRARAERATTPGAPSPK